MTDFREKREGFSGKFLRMTIAGGVLSAVLVIVYFATWQLFFERMYYTEKFMPYLFGCLAVLPLICWIANTALFRRKTPCALCIAAAAAGIVGHTVMLAYVLSKLLFLLTAGAPYFAAVGFAAAVLAVVFAHKLGKRAKTAVVCLLSGVFAVVVLVGYFNLVPFYFNSGAVVFAVGDEYQICWSTSAPSTGYVEVGGEKYYDDTAGTMDASTLHKATVPRSVLDSAQGYRTVSRQIFRQHTYLTVGAGSIAKDYPFRVPDLSDGLQVYNISDNHLLNAGAAAAGKFWGDGLDVLIANGDHVNDLENAFEITMMYKLLSEVTSSSRPVIVSRGNHETAGPLADKFPDYIGSRDGKFYYTTVIGGVMFLVLDFASIETDDNPVVSAVANFDEYRAEELEWLERTADEWLAGAFDADRLVVVCHVPYGIRAERYYPEFSHALISITERMGADLLIGGHVHLTEFHYPNTGINAADYAVVAGSIRNDAYPDHESVSAFRFTGTALEIREDGITVMFTDQNKDVKGVYEV